MMPRICQFHGVEIYMYFNDHLPPHFHALHGDDEALIEWQPPKVYRGRLPRRIVKMVVKWAALHRTELDQNWQFARNGQSHVPIPPLP